MITLDVVVPNRGKVHLVNIYGIPVAKGIPREKYEFYEKMDVQVNSNSPIIMAGDFNCVEDRTLDKCPVPKNNWGYINKGLEYLKRTHELKDLYRINNPCGKQFTYKAHDSKGRTVQSRLDRFLCTDNFIDSKFEHKQFIFSDHDLVIMKIKQFNRQKFDKGYYRTNTKIFDKDFFELFQNEWQNLTNAISIHDNILDWWMQTKQALTERFKARSKYILRSRDKQIKQLNRKLNALRQDLNQNKNKIKQYNDTKGMLRQKYMEKYNKQFIQYQAKDMDQGDRCTKHFFRKFKEQRKKTNVQQLTEDGTGITYNQNADKVKVATNFYKKMYNESNTEEIIENVFINNLDIRLGEQSKNELEQEINEEEIKEAIDKMKKAKVPGIDGIPVEFYTWGWKIVKKQFVEVLQYVQKSEDIHDKFLDGLIAVVHKKGDTKEIKNYRPLTLLNVDYKIYMQKS